MACGVVGFVNDTTVESDIYDDNVEIARILYDINLANAYDLSFEINTEWPLHRILELAPAYWATTLDQPDAVAPGFHIFHASRIAWFETADDLPRHERFRPDTRGLEGTEPPG